MFTSRLPGALLLTLAFLALTAEGAARTDPSIKGLIVPAIDVITVLWPEYLISLEVRITSLFGPAAWDPVALAILALPAWMTLAVPGAAILWLSSRGSHAATDVDSGAATHRLFEDLARAAEADGVRDTDPDMDPQTTLATDITPVADTDEPDDDTAAPAAPASEDDPTPRAS